jgi:hypothetical protein
MQQFATGRLLIHHQQAQPLEAGFAHSEPIHQLEETLAKSTLPRKIGKPTFLLVTY